MKRSIKITFSILLIIALLIPIKCSYAIEKAFFEISKLEVSKNDEIEIVINLEKIKYNKCLFQLKTSQNIENIKVNNEKLDVEKSDNEISIEINKNEISLSKITLYYKVPETIQIDDKIKFVATITNMESEDEKDNTQTIEKEVKIIDDIKNENTSQIENKDNNKTENNNSKSLVEEQKSDNKEENQVAKSNNIEGKSQQNTNINSKTEIAKTQTTQNQGETIIYNGSSNNYLTELSVEGYDLNKTFTKENSTYFVTVDNEVSSLNIISKTEEATSTVKIYGNNELNAETNKILICVTSESGSSRNYRIYVIKKSNNAINNNHKNNNAQNISSTGEVKSNLTEELKLHATYYLEECYIQINQLVKAGENILKYTNGTYLTAPYDCIITKIEIPNEGEKCTNSHCITIASNNNLMVQIKASENKINSFTLGQKVNVKISAYSDKTIEGVVTNISNTASNGDFTVNIDFENDGDIKIGMTANISISNK